ncbi:hypothetical protein JCM19046_4698 [Bacillus sp. JCM 19046]|nr:hypothetical protein JCM19046_4698 [Bacillus sp. JCM 19046]
MIDISGYALSSQRGEIASLNYLFNIIIAQKYKIPMFLMPQSFGPFEYDNKKRMINLIQDKLNYPTKIFAREQDGFNKLTDLGLKNAELTLDTVLQAKDEIQVSNIYKNKELLKLKVLKNSISIIPNDKIMEHGDKDKIFSIYKSLVSKALLEGKNIYLLRHSYEDLYICKQIKNEFKNEERVILIEEDLDCLEINDTLKQFDYIIASRYHSIIHGYRNGVPAIVLGWAVKYQELLNRFKQDMYLFDVRGSLDETDVNNSFDLLNKNYLKESEEIKDILNQIHSLDIFKEVV